MGVCRHRYHLCFYHYSPNKNMHTSIYIYIYIYILSSTDCFIVLQLFSMARLMRWFKLRLKLGWLYVCSLFYPRAIAILSIRGGIFLQIHYQLPEVFNSWKEQLHFSICGSRHIFPLEYSTHEVSIYIVIHRQTVLLYHNSSLYIYIYIYIYIFTTPIRVHWLLTSDHTCTRHMYVHGCMGIVVLKRDVKLILIDGDEKISFFNVHYKQKSSVWIWSVAKDIIF